MKSILIIAGVILLITHLSSCSESPVEYTREWSVQIRYADNTIDTLNFTSECCPRMNIRSGVSILHTCGGRPMASYVKSFKILSEKKVRA
jgi:hypothetical protein